MENSWKVFADEGDPQSREYWPMAQAARLDLHLIRVLRVNVLLMGTDGVIQDVLTRLGPHLRDPIEIWRAPERLDLWPPQELGTLILRDIGDMSRADQSRLLEWLELSAGHTQVVSTTRLPLLTSVEANIFLDTLYYRLNTVCVDLT